MNICECTNLIPNETKIIHQDGCIAYFESVNENNPNIIYVKSIEELIYNCSHIYYEWDINKCSVYHLKKKKNFFKRIINIFKKYE